MNILSSTRVENNPKPAKKRRRVHLIDSDDENKEPEEDIQKPLFQSSKLFDSNLSSIRMSQDLKKKKESTIKEADDSADSDIDDPDNEKDDVRSVKSDASSVIRSDDDEDAANAYSEDEANVDNKLLDSLKKSSKRKANSAPRAKLDPTRLLGKLGLSSLLDLSKNIKIKGRGKELEDLDSVMNIFQIWSHQMFPKMTYAQVIEKLEVLGKKREVQYVLRQIREGNYSGPKTQSEEFVTNDDDVPEKDDDHDPNDIDQILKNKQEEFDKLFDNIPAKLPGDISEEDVDDFEDNLQDIGPIPEVNKEEKPKEAESSVDASKIEAKRLAALERLKAKKSLNSSIEMKNRLKEALGSCK